MTSTAATPGSTTAAAAGSSVNGAIFSNPLYMKTPIVGFLGAWPLAVLAFVIYFYNIYNYRNLKLTAKMVFFPVLFFPGIVDNVYDIHTGGDVGMYTETSLSVLIAAMTIMATISIAYLVSYTYESTKKCGRNGCATLGQDDGGYATLGQDDSAEVTVFSRAANDASGRMDRWRRIVDEYMTANVVWGVTSYNMMLILIYAARYITHADRNLVREIDMVIISSVLLVFLVLLGILDFFMFKNPASGSVFMHYVIAAVFALSFTIDFHSQVGYCELLTLGTFFAACFMAVYKLVLFMEIGTPAGKKND